MPEDYQEQKLHLTALVKNIRAVAVEQCTRPPPPHEVAIRVIDLYLKIFTHLKRTNMLANSPELPPYASLYLHRSGNTSVFKVYASWTSNICYCDLSEPLSLKFLRVLNPAFTSTTQYPTSN